MSATYPVPEIFCKNLKNRAYIIPTDCAGEKDRHRLRESYVRACVCTYVCEFARGRASISWKLLRVPSPACRIPRSALSWIDAHFSIFTIKRACHRGFDAKERNYMDHFDGKTREGKRNGGGGGKERDGMTGKRNGRPLVDGDFPRRAWRLNKLRRSSLAIFFPFLRWITYKRIPISKPVDSQLSRLKHIPFFARFSITSFTWISLSCFIKSSVSTMFMVKLQYIVGQ